MTWDYDEQRKSRRGADAKKRVADMDAVLLKRASDKFSETDLRIPTHYTVLRGAAEVMGEDADHVESIWRAASGSAHGKAWPSLALQHVLSLAEYEPGQLPTLRIPDTDGMTAVIELAGSMTTYGVLRHADFVKADIATALDDAKQWLASVVPFRDDADPDVIARLKAGPPA